MNIHEKIKLARLLSGYRQADLADAIGLKQSVIARYEAMEGRVPRSDAIEKIAETTGWPITWFDSDRLDGIILCNYTSPRIDYSETALSTIEKGIKLLLPELFKHSSFNDAKVYRYVHKMRDSIKKEDYIDEIYIILSDDLCFIINPTRKFNRLTDKIILSKYFGPDIIFEQALIAPSSLYMWEKPYSKELINFLKDINIPEKFISAIKLLKVPTLPAKKFTIEITPPAGEIMDLTKEIEMALSRSEFIVHSVKLLQ